MDSIKMAHSLHISEIILYRNKIVTRLRSRVKHFGTKVNYYHIRLEQIDQQYPQLRGYGIINLKGVTK